MEGKYYQKHITWCEYTHLYSGTDSKTELLIIIGLPSPSNDKQLVV